MGIYEKNDTVSMGMSFFAMPFKQEPVLGRFKMVYYTQSLRINCSVYIHYFETTIALSNGKGIAQKKTSPCSCNI